MAETNNILINKLDRFIRKFYKNQLIRGAIYTFSALLLFYVSLVTLEYYGEFNTSVRTSLFYTFIIIGAVILGRWIVLPLVKLNRLGKVLSHEQAASIIGDHFPNIKDKLLNTLQLRQQTASVSDDHRDLLEASIDQRTVALQPVPFTKAIDFKENRKYLRLAIPPFLILLGLILINANIISDGTERLINHGDEYLKPAPFMFMIDNDALEVVEQEDFLLEVRLERADKDVPVPEHLFIEVDGNRFRLNKEDNVRFTYLFKNVQKDKQFKLAADELESGSYDLTTIPSPTLLNFDVVLDYPSYTGQTDETIRNSGDLLIPAGTRVRWAFKTQNTEGVDLIFSDSVYTLNPNGKDAFGFAKSFSRSKNYAITTSNAYMSGRDSIRYRINVVPDQYPAISVDEQQDSTSTKRIYFSGQVKDDYGFKRLSFNYRFVKAIDSLHVEGELKSVSLPINTTQSQDDFYHFWNLAEIGIQAGEELEYYFEVYDNDGVNGSKSSRTQMRKFNAPTSNELEQKRDEQSEAIKEKMDEALSEAQKLKEEVEAAKLSLMSKKSMSWNDQQRVKNLLKKQNSMQNLLDELKKDYSKSNEQQREYQKQDEELMKKQEELQKLFDELMTDEMKELFKELEKLLEEMNKDAVQEKLEEMEMSNEDMEKELERTLEIFKEMEFQENLDGVIEKLEEMAKKEEELAQDTRNEEGTKEELKERQEEIKDDFKALQEQLDALEEKNEALEKKHEMPDTEAQEESIEQKMEESSEQMDAGKDKKASESQQGAAQEMKDMASEMKDMQAQQAEQQKQEDLDALRALLENLVHLSFDQEALMDELKTTRTNDPRYVELGQQQKKLQDDARMIEDSLLALSKRVVQLESTINREINNIENNMGKAIRNIADRKTGQANSRQQYVMTSLNELALIFDEALQQMQNAMAQKMPGTGNCEKPGGSGAPKPGKGKPKMGDMKSMQKALSDQIEQMKKDLEKGKQPGGKKPGEQPGGQMPGGKTQGQGAGGFDMKPGMSKQIAEMAKKQEDMRRKMEEMAQEMDADGSGGGEPYRKIAKDMEKNEEDLVNLDLSIETINRQQEILTRLLEAENAERERGKKEERESEEAKSEEISNPEAFFEYKRKKEKEVELLKTVPPTLKPYYKNKVNQYFNTFEE